MSKTRLEAFSDAVIAIILTIMVLELKVPEGSSLEDLMTLVPKFLSYVLSFAYIGIYWNAHHHLFHGAKRINGKILLINMNLLFWLSLIPFATGWMGENSFEGITVAVYGLVLFAAALSYFILTKSLIKESCILQEVLGDYKKERVSLVLYFGAFLVSTIFPEVSLSIYALVAIMWLIPDKRIENNIENFEGCK